MAEERENVVVLVDEDGVETAFEVLDIIEDGDNRYAAMLAADEPAEDTDEDMVWIMRIVAANEEEDTLEPIEDQAELEHVFSIFKTRMEDDFDFEEE